MSVKEGSKIIENKNPKMWMVRCGGSKSVLILDFLQKDMITIGWAIGNIEGITKDELKNLISSKYPSSTKNQVNIYATIIWRFLSIKQGDYVLTYDSLEKIYHFGIVSSDYKFSKEPLHFDDSGPDSGPHRHYREVKWEKEFSRDDLPGDTKKALNQMHTVFELKGENKQNILNIVGEIEPPIVTDGGFMSLEKDVELICVEPKEIEEASSELTISHTVYRNIANSIDSGKHIILEGIPGTGKTVLANALSNVCKNKEYVNDYIQTVATSDWSTYDTIGGLMPDKDGNLYFSEGIVLKSIRNNNLLIIDEINRADIDKAFGPLFTVLSGQKVVLNYKYYRDVSDKGQNIKIVPDLDWNKSCFDEETATYYVGKNWRIIGTMNTYDKDSLYELSYAFMRRFFFVNVDAPDTDDFEELVDDAGKNLDDVYLEKVKLLLKLNDENYSRKIGPAVFIDLIEYLETCQKYDEDKENMFEDAVIGYIIPQFEGMTQDSLDKCESFLTDSIGLDEDKIGNKFLDIRETF